MEQMDMLSYSVNQAWQGYCFNRFNMINFAIKSRHVPLDAPSIGKSSLNSRQEPGRTLGMMARQFEGGATCQ